MTKTEFEKIKVYFRLKYTIIRLKYASKEGLCISFNSNEKAKQQVLSLQTSLVAHLHNRSLSRFQ